MVAKEIQEERIARLRAHLVTHGVDGLLMKTYEGNGSAANIRYFTDFTGSHGNCILTPENMLFVTDGRYTEQAESQAIAWDVRIVGGDKKLPGYVQELAIRRLGLIAEQITWKDMLVLEKNLPGIELVAIHDDIGQEVRAVKSEEEVVHIRAAIVAIEKALVWVYKFVASGMTELELARILEQALPHGAKIAFDPIIVSGVRSALPHGRASEKVIEKGDIIQFDVGCALNGYISDISRVAVVGKATAEQKKMHRAVLAALNAAMPLYRPGAKRRDAHSKASQVLVHYGYSPLEKHHTLGHGIGLEMHEEPNVTPSVPEDKLFVAGHVATNEPGIYIEGYGGMRIEEDVLITPMGHEVLTKFPTELQEL